MNALSHQLGIEIVSLIGVEISKELLGLVDASILRKNRMVPIDFYNGNVNVVRLAMADLMDMAAVDDFMMITNLQVEPVLALPNEIMLTLDRYFENSETLAAAQNMQRSVRHTNRTGRKTMWKRKSAIPRLSSW